MLFNFVDVVTGIAAWPADTEMDGSAATNRAAGSVVDSLFLVCSDGPIGC